MDKAWLHMYNVKKSLVFEYVRSELLNMRLKWYYLSLSYEISDSIIFSLLLRSDFFNFRGIFKHDWTWISLKFENYYRPV